MKRVFCLIFTLLIAFTAVSFTPAHAYSADDLEIALEQFRACAFSAEYGGNGRDYTVRWQGPIRVYFSGYYTDMDISFFYRFIEDLSRNVRDFPVISMTTSEIDSNIQIYFTELDQMQYYVSDYREGNWGYFTFWNSGYECTDAQIAIATDQVNQFQRNHLMMEELVGALGLANDHYIDSQSILYGEWTETNTLTEADWLMLNFLYDQRIPVGLTWDQAAPLIKKYYK